MDIKAKSDLAGAIGYVKTALINMEHELLREEGKGIEFPLDSALWRLVDAAGLLADLMVHDGWDAKDLHGAYWATGRGFRLVRGHLPEGWDARGLDEVILYRRVIDPDVPDAYTVVAPGDPGYGEAEPEPWHPKT